MSIRKRDVHFSDWTKVRHALVCNNVQGITETSSFDDVRAFLINSESGSNPFYYYVCYIKETKEIYTHGQFYDCSNSDNSVILEKIEELESTLGTKVDLTVLNDIKAEIEENEKVAAKAFMDLNERKLDKSELNNIDLSNYVDFDTYYNNLNSTNSAINLKADKTTVTLLQATVDLKANKTDLDTLSAEVDLKADQADLNTLSAEVDLKANQTDLDALSAEVEENEEVTAAALTELHENKADKSEIPDVSAFATNSDLNTKQDLLVSGTNIKTVNGDSILGEGNIEIHDTKVTSAANHYGYNSDNATSTTGAFVTKITKDEANHVTSFESRALTSTDIPGLDASKITSGTIDIARLPKGALEQLHHYETTELAQQAVIDKAVQLGDTVQINHATMYICTNDSATTFATQFTEYVAGTAASVPWSGITGKPTGIDEWGNRIGVIESNYATQSWVGENYLPLSGGTISKLGRDLLIINDTSSSTVNRGAYITFTSKAGDNQVKVGYNTSTGAFFNIENSTTGNTYTVRISKDGDGVSYDNQPMLHSGNFSNYALPLTGGTLTGALTINRANVTNLIYLQTNGTNAATVGYENGWGAILQNIKGGAYIAIKDDDSIVASNPVTASKFIGALQGNADSATTVYLGNSNANGAFPVPFVSNATVGNKSLFVSTTNTLIFNPSTGGLSAKSFIGNLTGNADSASKLATARTIWGQSFNGEANVTGDMSGVGSITATGDLTLYATGTNDSPALHFLRGTSADNTVDYKIYNTGGILKFDYIKADAPTTKFSYGSNDGFVVNDKITATSYIRATHFRQNTIAITSSIDDSFRTKFTGDSGSSYFIASGRTSSDAAGSLLGSYAPLIAFGAADTHGFLQVGYNSANIKVGGGSDDKINWTVTLIHSGNYASYALANTGGSLTGAVTSTSTFSATDFITTSDNRLKDFTKDVIIDFNELKNIPKKYYYWKDKSMGEELQIGTSAQELAKVYPECVSYNEKEDRYSVNYQKLSIIALAAIDKLHERISVLEKKLNDQNS